MFRPALLLLATLALLLPGCGYNQIQTNEEAVFRAWADVEATYQRRADLIPNLVETVKAYAAHEQETFERVIQARNMAMSAQTVGEHSQTENMLTGALKSLFALAEAYPDLKANQNFMMLQEELSGTESKIAYARQFYNDSVMTFNTSTQTFPANVIAGMFGFTQRDYFEIEEAAKEPVKVQF